MKQFRKISKCKQVLLVVIAVVFFLTLISVIIEQCTHGPQTPRLNRYWHPFSFSDINWFTIVACIGAYLSLLFPWYRYCFADDSRLYVNWGIFPAQSWLSKAISLLLTLFGAFSGISFTASNCYSAFQSLSGVHTIMMEDEDGTMIVLFVFCIVFWGIISYIYKLVYSKQQR